ncbi:hypothetical protein HYH03_001542 [Edaphochlamys debaryana]|uniref:Ion transport domain-containing protein n=1 Tax=Edaphochlamys debaryana TaxID=47281 RepID=A0A835YLK7_9CHLO|nr:hypothetical protein HYH03_001542 [Edaphochlamys debaryana]|eukprot:KAG2500780.1 hypothetical protein HYH03_001542 [Edaphochlamys debaryana]
MKLSGDLSQSATQSSLRKVDQDKLLRWISSALTQCSGTLKEDDTDDDEPKSSADIEQKEAKQKALLAAARLAISVYSEKAVESGWSTLRFVDLSGKAIVGLPFPDKKKIAAKPTPDQMASLLLSAGAVLSKESLARWAALSGSWDGWDGGEQFLLWYLLRSRNPLAVAMATAQGLGWEADRLNNTAPAEAARLREITARLRTLALALVQGLALPEACADPETRPWAPLDRALQSAEATGAARAGALLDVDSTACPMTLALEMGWMEFYAEPVLQGYCEHLWTQPVHKLKKGLTQGLLEPSAPEAAFFMVQGLDTSLAASARGRWIVRLVFEAFFLYIFHSIQLMPADAGWAWQHVVFAFYLAGQVVDEAQEWSQLHRCGLYSYLSDGFNAVELACWGMLMAASGTQIALWAEPEGQSSEVATARDFLLNTSAILVWARLLQFLVPMHERVGSLLMMLSRMFVEVFLFAVPGLVLLTGVSFTLYGVFRGRLEELSSFPLVMLQLYRSFLGETMFDVYDAEGSTGYAVYGYVITVLYTLVATVVLANVLIALITFHFQSDQVGGWSARPGCSASSSSPASGAWRRRARWLGAPFTLPMVLLWWLLPSRQAPTPTVHGGVQPVGRAALPYLVCALCVSPLFYALLLPTLLPSFAAYMFSDLLPSRRQPPVAVEDRIRNEDKAPTGSQPASSPLWPAAKLRAALKSAGFAAADIDHASSKLPPQRPQQPPPDPTAAPKEAAAADVMVVAVAAGSRADSGLPPGEGSGPLAPGEASPASLEDVEALVAEDSGVLSEHLRHRLAEDSGATTRMTSSSSSANLE